jgi:branched-chain amino acid transport system permease protein
MLETRALTVRFGGMTVVDDLSLTFAAGQVTGLIGPNGAGKTTLFDCVTGFVRAHSGTVLVDGRPLRRLAPQVVAAAGVARTFQTPRMFDSLTTLENLVVAGAPASAVSSFLTTFRFRRHQSLVARLTARAREQAAFVGLAAVQDNRADALSGGQRKLLEIGRALMRDPTVLLLDEPVAGVNPVLARQIAATIRQVADRGVAVGVIEHNLEFVMANCTHVSVMAQGSELASGTADDVRRRPEVLDAYLGGHG